MKRFASIMGLALVLCLTALGQTYPTLNPVYTPTATMTAQSITATGDFQVFTNHGKAGAMIQVAGSPSGLVGAVQGTVDGTNYVSIASLEPVGGGPLVSSITGAGIWRFSVAGFTKVRFHVTGYTSGATTVRIAAVEGPNAVRVMTNAQDPCADPNVAKSSAVINVGAATTTKIVDVSGTKTTYVCGFVATLAGTTPTVIFKSGTNASTDCDTGAANLSGTFAPTSGLVLSYGGAGSSIFAPVAAKQVCATTAGSGSSFQGILTYVQQ